MYNISKFFADKEKRGWKKTYWFIDFHGTIAVPDYGDKSKREFYPYAKETLQILSDRDDVCLVLWTCSHDDDIEEMLAWLKTYDIKFDYINENPECESTKRVNLEKKPYYNVLIDDRAGFDPEVDWFLIGIHVANHYGEKVLK